MSSTHPQPPTATTESPPNTSISDSSNTASEAPATFDTGCRRRLGCLIDAENRFRLAHLQ